MRIGDSAPKTRRHTIMVSSPDGQMLAVDPKRHLSIVSVVTEAHHHIIGDDTDVTTQADALDSCLARGWFAFYIVLLEGDVSLVHFGSLMILAPMSFSRIGGRAQLGGRMEDLVNVLDGEAVDRSECLGKMLLLAIRGDRQAAHHIVELLIGQRSIIDDSAINCDKIPSVVRGAEFMREERWLAGVRPSDAIFCNVDETVLVECHVLDSLDVGVLGLHSVSETQAMVLGGHDCTGVAVIVKEQTPIATAKTRTEMFACIVASSME
jgi:hypothetical protein